MEACSDRQVLVCGSTGMSSSLLYKSGIAAQTLHDAFGLRDGRFVNTTLMCIVVVKKNLH